MIKFFKLFPAALFFAVAVNAQSPQVPSKMQVAGITLHIKEDARKEIQKDVDALTQSPRYFNIKVEKAKTYFPIIEKVFAEERVPDELKYLVLQESALIADAVSVSNAVGFWQFKDFTAIEMGLRVDNVIDERMNIASSSRAAAGYLKKNNYYFNNWIYAVQAYQMGAGGALKVVDEKYFGAKQMDVDAKTYWYVKKFLAHVVAFQDAVKGTAQVQVAAVPINEEKNISRLAKELSIDEAELREFNKWVRTDKIPADRTYTLVLPSGKFDFEKAGALAAASASTSKAEPKPADVKASERRENTSTRGSIVMHNDLPVIRASAGENVSSLASRSGIGLKKFLKYNDLSISSNIKEGELYYLKPKRRYGYSTEAYHVVQPNDKLWQISQDYAIKLNRLKTLNNVYQDNALKQGMHLWLSGGKQGQNLARAEIALVDAESTFNWSLSPQQEAQQATQSVVKDEVDKTAPDLKVEQPAYGHQSVKVEQEISIHQAVQKPEEVKAKAADNEVKEDNSQDVIQVIAPSSSNSTKIEQHTVQTGETLYAISRKYQLNVKDLIAWNKLEEPITLKPGQVLQIAAPVVATKSEQAIWHEVKGADTLYSIARNYEVTIKDLMEWNNKKDFNLTVGEKLRILKP